jgi:WD40 repeat protein
MMEPDQLEICQRRLHSQTPVFGKWLRWRAAKALAFDGSPRAFRMLAKALTDHPDSGVRGLVAGILRQVRKPEAIDAVCAVWQETRHDALTKLLGEGRWLAGSPIDLRVLTALKTGQERAIAGQGPGFIAALAKSCGDRDREIAARAIALLGQLQNPKEIEALCDLLIRSDLPALRKVAIDKSYAPQGSGRRALFYFLTGQNERYEALDFDHALLRANFEAADPELRRRIASRVRTSGRAELTTVLQGRREKRHLSEMTAREWETVVKVLSENRRYDDLWALAFEALPEWSAETLGILKDANYRPANDTDRVTFDKLCKLRPAEGKHLSLLLPVPHCRRILKAHEHGVRTLAFSPDGKTLATGSNDTIALLWDVTEGRVKASLPDQGGSVLALAFSSDGQILAAGGADGKLRLWDAASGQLEAVLSGHTDRITTLAFSPDGQMLATGSFDGTVRLWNPATRQCMEILEEHSRGVLALSFSPDGKIVASGSHDETARLWHALSGQSKAVLSGHSSSVCTLAFSPDGRTLITGSSDGTARFWNVANGEFKAELPGHKGSIMSLAFSPNGRRLATAGLDKAVRIWEVATRQLKATLSGHQDEVHALAFSPDGKLLATGSRDATARLWEIAHAQPLIAMTRQDLEKVQKWSEVLTNPEEARGWHFVAALLRHRCRFDVELGEIAERVFGEFDIEIQESEKS